jgi:enamine deaminase RidA (YjgF/YER057c/UK114 family)
MIRASQVSDEVMKKQTISDGVISNPVPSHALATRAGPFLFMSGQLGLSSSSDRPFSGYREFGGEPPYPALGLLAPNSWEETFVTQTHAIYDRIGALQASQRASPQDIVFHSVYVRDMRDFPTLARTRSRLFSEGLAPPVTTSQVGGLSMDDAVVYFDPIGFVPTQGFRLETLRSKYLAQGALSNYQFGAKVGPLMFFAGVVAAMPERGEIIHGSRDLPENVRAVAATGSPAARAFADPVRAQTAFIYDLFGRFLREQGADFEHLVKLNVYLRDVRDTGIVEDVARELAPRAAPAVALYGVESLATRWFLVEIEGIAVDPAGSWSSERLERLGGASDAIVPHGRHSLAVRAGPLIFTSTITAYHAGRDRLIDEPGELPEAGRRAVEAVVLSHPHLRRSASAARAAAQAWLIYDRVLRIAARFGGTSDDVLKTTVYLDSMSDFAAVDAIAQTFFPHAPPALAVLQPSALSMPGARVQIDAVILGTG